MADRWLNRFAVFTAFSTLLLISLGGLVTSHGAGLAVPDWPTTFGYNMFFFPIEKWTGGVFYEHTHRLVASVVGLLTVALAVWLWMAESRRWLRWLGVGAVVAVIFQGVLGGLRVTALKDELGIFHATLGQLFLVLLSLIALFRSAAWQGLGRGKFPIYALGTLRYFFAVITGMILLQLILGATMRHQHAGLAIPDFPAAYGSWWPDARPEAVARYNQLRVETRALNPITAGQIYLQMAHRFMALVILVLVAVNAVKSWRLLGGHSRVTRLSWAWLGLIVLQAGLGAATIWSNKSADIATAHVALGAVSLVLGALLCTVAFQARRLGQRSGTTAGSVGFAPRGEPTGAWA